MNKKLYKSRTQRKISGVCGGIAEYFEIDVTLIRLMALLLLFTGGGIIIYIVAAIVIPEAPIYNPNSDPMKFGYLDNEDYLSGKIDPMESQVDPGKTKNLLGWGLVIFASVMIMSNFLPSLPFKKYLLPVTLLVGGYYLISQYSNRN